MTLFRGQNYLPVVPFSSLVAAWAMVELWRFLAARLPWLAWRPVAALAGLAVGAALLAQQGTIVYTRVVPTTFERTNDALLAELDPVGLRHVVYERGMGAFESGGKPRRPLLTPVPRLTALAPDFLDRADVEIFPQRRLQGSDADFYRARVARLPKKRVEIVGDLWFRRRGEPLVVLRHPWTLARDPVDLLVRRPEGDPPYLVGRLPAGIARPGEAVSLLLWIPRDAEDRGRTSSGSIRAAASGGVRYRPPPQPPVPDQPALRPDRGRAAGARIPSAPDDRPRVFGLELYSWRPVLTPVLGAPLKLSKNPVCSGGAPSS